MRTRSLVAGERWPPSASSGLISGSSIAASSTPMAASCTSIPSSARCRTTPSSASGPRSARSIAEVTSPSVTKPRARPSATRSVICCASDVPLVSTVRLTKTSVRHLPLVSGDLIFGSVPPLKCALPAGEPLEQDLTALLKRHEVAEQPVVLPLLLHRVHPLEPGLGGGDLAADGELLDPCQDDVDIGLVRLAGHLDLFHGQLAQERPGVVVGGFLDQLGRPVAGAPRAGHAAASGDEGRHHDVGARRERGGLERVERRAA